MMGRSHAISGAAGWLGVCAAAAPLVGRPPVVVTTCGAVVAAAAALLPDVDHPQSTVSRSLGPVTGTIARVVSRASDTIRDATCGCCTTRGGDGHRTLTHTAVFAVAAGVVVSAAGWVGGHITAAIAVAASIGLASLVVRLRRRTRAAVPALAIAAAAAIAHWGHDVTWWWLGLPVGLGVLLHALGDAATHSGAPLLWPLRVRGCRWQRVGTPRWARFRTGSPVETVVAGLMAAGGLTAGWALLV